MNCEGFYNCYLFSSSSSRELKYGIPVTDENGNRLGESPNAAKQAIMQVVVSRIGMAVPAMGNNHIITEPTENDHPNLQLLLALLSFIMRFSSLFSCPTHNFIVLAHSCSQAAIFFCEK